MLHVINRIAEKRLQFGEHQFFDRLMSDASLQEVLPFAKHITFWVMTFQDILRINQLLAVTREVKRITHHHMAEDAGHQFWFLDDLHTIEASWPNVKWLFGSEHEQTRTSSFRLMSEVFRITKEHNRIVLLLVLEALGQEFFTRISDFLEKNGIFHSLRYFGRTHLTVEKQHEMFEIKMMEGIVSRAM